MNFHRMAFVLVMMSVAINAVGQSDSLSPQVSLARCAYAVSGAECSSSDATTLAQFPRRGPGPRRYPPPPRVHMARSMPGPSWKGALIGGLIGFGLGVAAPRDANAGKRVAAGTFIGFIGAGIGAAIGANHANYHYHYNYRYPSGPWPDDEEAKSSNKRATGSTGLGRQIAQNTAPEGTGTSQPASDK